MGQGMLFSRGSRYSEIEDPNIVGWRPKTEIIDTTRDWTVPKASQQRFQLLMFGGGGGPAACMFSGAGGGYMCKTTVNVTKGSTIRITIGAGGGTSQNGGTTSFGPYASANGGGTPKIINIEKGRPGGGGTPESAETSGGDGGTGGGATIYVHECTYYSTSGYNIYAMSSIAKGGDAQYGGGGGGFASGGKGGIYGGNGGSWNTNAKNGINTLTSMYANETYRGKGTTSNLLSMYYREDIIGSVDRFYDYSWRSGGGGYGGIGASGIERSEDTPDEPDEYYTEGNFGGGGGGWGSSPLGSGGGGYGSSGYGAGGYDGIAGNSGICVITYYEPIWINA